MIVLLLSSLIVHSRTEPNESFRHTFLENDREQDVGGTSFRRRGRTLNLTLAARRRAAGRPLKRLFRADTDDKYKTDARLFIIGRMNPGLPETIVIENGSKTRARFTADITTRRPDPARIHSASALAARSQSFLLPPRPGSDYF